MAKFGHFTLDLKKGEILNLDQLTTNQRNSLYNGDIIYIYRSTKKKKIYIGQTGRFINRHKQHYNGLEEKFNVAEFNQVKILVSQYFNGSALDDVENQLITYFVADNPKSTKIFFGSDEIINGNSGNTVNDYKNRERISFEVILPFWEDVLAKEGWVTTPTLNELRAGALVKYSPIKQLTEEQIRIISEILENPTNSYVINGDAGTGKTVLLTHIVAKLLSGTKNKRIAVIVQPNWEKTAKNIFKTFGLNSSNLTISTSIKMINQKEYYDTIIVDESHRLSRRGSKQHNAFNTIYKNPEFSNCQNHLEPIIALGRQVILMYDVLQAIRPANISRETFQQLTTTFEKRYLTTQFRIQAPEGKNYSSSDYVNGIKYLLYKDTGLLQYTNFDDQFNRALFHDNNPDAYFGYFNHEPLKNLIDWLDEDRNYNPEHVNRVLSGLVEDWKQSDGKDPSITHFHEGNISRRWNSTQENWIESSDADAEDQIGSVFAVQGIDLNKIGVLIGKDLLVDDQGKLYAEPNNFRNVNGKHTKEEFGLPATREEFTMFVLNIYYVLLTRGIDGIRIGFWHNEKFKEYFKRTFEII